MKKIYIASDHGGFHLKQAILKFLKVKGVPFEDMSKEFNTKDDYPDVAIPLALRVSKEKSRGILVCANGVGMSLAANKVKGIRAAPILTKAQCLLARLHNNINILCLGGLNLKSINEKRLKAKDYKDLLDLGLKPNTINDVKEIIEIFLKTEFEGGRHLRRIKKFEKTR